MITDDAATLRDIAASGGSSDHAWSYDALFFDELFLLQTASDPSMPKPRFAIENGFFGGSGFPAGHDPIAV